MMNERWFSDAHQARRVSTKSDAHQAWREKAWAGERRQNTILAGTAALRKFLRGKVFAEGFAESINLVLCINLTAFPKSKLN